MDLVEVLAQLGGGLVHRAQWRASLEMYAYPIIGDIPVSAIETKDVLAILLPNWKDRTETMNRVRGEVVEHVASHPVGGEVGRQHPR